MTDLYTNSFSDNVRFFKSKYMTYSNLTDAETEYNIVRIPRNALIVQMHVMVVTAFDGAVPTMTVGWTCSGEEDADGFLTNVETEIGVAGYKVPIAGTNINAGGYYFADASGTISVTLDPDTSTVGALYVFGGYTVIM